jgi:hypothetical protein
MSTTSTPSANDARPRSRVVTALVVGAFVIAVAVTVVQPFLQRDVAASAFTRALAARASLVQRGDTVLVHPPWRDDVVTALRASALVPASVTITEVIAPRHGDPLPSLVVVADEGWPLPRNLAARVPADASAVEGVRVFRIGGASSSSSTSGLDDGRARVHVETAAGTRIECPWLPARRRHVCNGLPEWMTVGDDTLLVQGRRERCTWAHPITGGVVVVDYGVVDVPPTGLTLSAALTDAAADNPAGAAVTVSALLDDDERSVTVQHERGFQDVHVAAPAVRGRLQVRVTTANDGQRHTCYRLAPASVSP